MNPDTSLSNRDLLIWVAEALNVASYVNPDDTNDNRARPPTDPQRLDRCQRAVNAGISLMTRDNRTAGGWYALRPRVTINVGTDTTAPSVLDGDTQRYRLPWQVQGQPTGAWVWKVPGSTLSGELHSLHPDQVDRMTVYPASLNYPLAISVVPHTAVDANDRSGWEVRVWPSPSQPYTISASFRHVPKPMSNLADRHPFGAIHDETVIAACKWAAVRDDKGMADERGAFQSDYAQALAASIKIDLENAAQKLGAVRDPSCEIDDSLIRPWPPRVAQFDGIPVT